MNRQEFEKIEWKELSESRSKDIPKLPASRYTILTDLLTGRCGKIIVQSMVPLVGEELLFSLGAEKVQLLVEGRELNYTRYEDLAYNHCGTPVREFFYRIDGKDSKYLSDFYKARSDLVEKKSISSRSVKGSKAE